MVAAYDPATGRRRWSTEALSGEIGSSPAYAAGRVFAANQYAKAVALDAATGAILWSHDDLELPDAGSPVATEKHLFMPTSHGPFSCLAANDGSIVWQHEFDLGGYGSPVLAGDRLYWVTADGRTRIIKASDTFELIAEPALGEASVCTPAAVGRRLYLRGARHLFCLEAKASDEP
jgi:outer membrane protein assembly factor BamB